MIRAIKTNIQQIILNWKDPEVPEYHSKDSKTTDEDGEKPQFKKNKNKSIAVLVTGVVT